MSTRMKTRTNLAPKRAMIKKVGYLTLISHLRTRQLIYNHCSDQHDSEDSDDELSDIEPLNDTTHTDMSHFGGTDNMGFLESLIQEMGNEGGDAAGTTWEPYNIFGEDNDENSDEMHIDDEPANNNKR
jgi:hypothetical protein